MTKDEFLAAAVVAAKSRSAVSGLDAMVTVAQAALESNFGQSRLSQKANNYFGIKAKSGQPSVEMRTWEVVNGKRIEIRARFAKFASMEECFAARDHMILRLPCYAEARACASDPEAFVRALAKRWATDRSYASKLLNTARKIRLIAPKPKVMTANAQ